MENNYMEPLTVRRLIKRLLHECDDLDAEISFYVYADQETVQGYADDKDAIEFEFDSFEVKSMGGGEEVRTRYMLELPEIEY